MVVYGFSLCRKTFQGMNPLDMIGNILWMIIYSLPFSIYVVFYLQLVFFGSWLSFINWFVWSSSKHLSIYLVLFIKTTPRILSCFRMLESFFFVIADQLLCCICRDRVFCYIFRKRFEALFLNTINCSLVCGIYLLKYFDKTVQAQYVFCCYWI